MFEDEPRQFYCRFCLSISDQRTEGCGSCGESGTLLPVGYVLPEREARKPKGIVNTEEMEIVMIPRMKCGIPNLDQLFGGEERPGLPKGFTVQFGGPPGIGKSTILTQMCGSTLAKDALYIAAEETASRVAVRSKRCGCPNGFNICETKYTDEAMAAIEETDPKLVVVDSLNGMLFGSKDDTKQPNQFVTREIASLFIADAHKHNRTTFMIGHLNKEDKLSGLRAIEHDMDIIAHYIGDPQEKLRVVWCSKNREGDTTYKAFFNMTSKGLIPTAPPEKKSKKKKEDDE